MKIVGGLMVTVDPNNLQTNQFQLLYQKPEIDVKELYKKQLRKYRRMWKKSHNPDIISVYPKLIDQIAKEYVFSWLPQTQVIEYDTVGEQIHDKILGTKSSDILFSNILYYNEKAKLSALTLFDSLLIYKLYTLLNLVDAQSGIYIKEV